MPIIGKLTKWRSVPCKQCGAEAGAFCTSGKGNRKHEVTTYVHSDRKETYANSETNGKTSAFPRRWVPPSKNEPTFAGDADQGALITLSHTFLLEHPSVNKLSLTTKKGQNIETELVGDSFQIRIQPA